MASPSPAAVAAIKAQVATIAGGWSNTDAQLAAQLNAPSVANPQAQQQVPKRFVANDLASACAAANRANLVPLLAGAAAPLIAAQDAGRLGAGLDALATIGSLSAADVTAMKAVMGQTEPDPNYQAQIGWAQANIGRPVDVQDLYAARTT